MDDAFAVHDLTKNETTQVPPSGVGIKRKTIVRFFVGIHGPFQLEYDTGSYSDATARQDIANQVQSLRNLTAAY